MKSFLQITIVVLLTIAPAMTSAFAPFFSPVRSIGGKVNSLISSKSKFARLNVKIGMGGKPAKSKEADLELTRSIIMKHIASSNDDVVDDDDEAQQSTSSSVEPLKKKIKSVGKKIKNKVKSKLNKNE